MSKPNTPAAATIKQEKANDELMLKELQKIRKHFTAVSAQVSQQLVNVMPHNA